MTVPRCGAERVWWRGSASRRPAIWSLGRCAVCPSAPTRAAWTAGTPGVGVGRLSCISTVNGHPAHALLREYSKSDRSGARVHAVHTHGGGGHHAGPFGELHGMLQQPLAQGPTPSPGQGRGLPSDPGRLSSVPAASLVPPGLPGAPSGLSLWGGNFLCRSGRVGSPQRCFVSSPTCLLSCRLLLRHRQQSGQEFGCALLWPPPGYHSLARPQRSWPLP